MKAFVRISIISLLFLLFFGNYLFSQSSDKFKFGLILGNYDFSGDDAVKNGPLFEEIDKGRVFGFTIEFLPVEYFGIGYQRHDVSIDEPPEVCETATIFGIPIPGSCVPGTRVTRDLEISNNFWTLNIRLFTDRPTSKGIVNIFLLYGRGTSTYQFSTTGPGVTNPIFPNSEKLNGSSKGKIEVVGLYMDLIGTTIPVGIRVGLSRFKTKFEGSNLSLNGDANLLYIGFLVIPREKTR